MILLFSELNVSKRGSVCVFACMHVDEKLWLLIACYGMLPADKSTLFLSKKFV